MHRSTEAFSAATVPKTRKRRVARILLADSELTSRLALNSILSTAGYAVDGAASAAEAIEKLDEREYQLVLADLRDESEDAGARVLAYARQKDFRPATALIASDMHETDGPVPGGVCVDRIVRVSNEHVSWLLDRVAELIGQRATRRIRQGARAAY